VERRADLLAKIYALILAWEEPDEENETARDVDGDKRQAKEAGNR
jgi:hypothetical protein